jgi:hypothetical protein
MLGNYRVASQLVASRVVLGSIELVSVLDILELRSDFVNKGAVSDDKNDSVV